jgi:hypothetical protein
MGTLPFFASKTGGVPIFLPALAIVLLLIFLASRLHWIGA